MRSSAALIRFGAGVLISRHVRWNPGLLSQVWITVDARSATRYIECVIKSFKHAGLEKFAKTGSKVGIQPKHATRLTEILFYLNRAEVPKDMDLYGWHLHDLERDLAGHWSVRVDPRWRITFRFDGADVILVNYQDYHE